jgi:Protein of unknown function (DUF2384)
LHRTMTLMATKFISGFGRSSERAKFISVEPAARNKARQYAHKHGGCVYRAVAVGMVISEHCAKDLGRGYIVAETPPIEFVYWGKYYAKITGVQDMSKTDRNQYVRAFGINVFQNRNAFQLWCKTKNNALGNVTPISLMKTASGAESVLSEIVRIEHGIFA